MRHLELKIRMAVADAIPAAFRLVAVTVAMVVLGQGIFPIATVGSPFLIGLQYKIRKRAALQSIGAEDLPGTQHVQIHQFAGQVCDEKNMKKPSPKIVSIGVPNAFAVGRRGSGTVVVSQGFIQLFGHDELEGVVARELAHVDNHGVITIQPGQGIILVVVIVAQYVVFSMGDSDLADFFLAIAVGQIVQLLAMTLVLAIPWYREYIVDADVERIIGSDDPLVRAFEKIQQGNQQTRESVRTAQRSHGRARRDQRRNTNVDQQVSASCISSPDRGSLQQIVSTHPPMEKRIERLRLQMPDLRELLTAILGVLLGIGLLAVPRMVLRLSVLAGSTRHRHGDHGTDDTIPDQWTWIVRGLGVISFAVAVLTVHQAYT